MVLLNNNFEYKVEKVISDTNGNFILLDINLEGKKFTLVNLYGPNDDKPKFYKELRQKYNSLNNDNVIMCGDWNLVINPDLDTNNYLHINNPRARNEILENIIEEDGFLDIYRILHEEKREYTWSRKNQVRKQARLDFFLISFECFLYADATSITPGYRTDHSGITLDLVFNYNNERGRGYWKFNNSLLKDQNYIKIVKDTISEVKQTYKLNNDDLDSKQTEFSINDQLFLETLLLMIRGNTFKYSSFKKKQQQQEEIKLEEEIKIIENEVTVNFINMSEETLDNLETKKTMLNNIQKEKIEGMMLRSRSRYEDLGEKPTRYFLNLEKRNYTSKVIHKLVNTEGEEFTSTARPISGRRCQVTFFNFREKWI